jgi:hypothetical protein
VDLKSFRNIACAWPAALPMAIPGSGNPEYVLAQLASAFNPRQSVHQACRRLAQLLGAELGEGGA